MNPENKNPSPETPRGTQRPRFSILHTSARPDKWRAVYDAWLAAADRPEDVEYVLVVDERWGFKVDCTVNTAAQFLPRWVEGTHRDGHEVIARDKVLINDGRRCYVEGVNLAAKHATGDILIVVADDQFPCEHWDREIVLTLPLHGVAPYSFVLWAPTGTPSEFERNIIVMPIMSRALYDKWGYVMYPGYESMYSDNDLCEHSRAEGVLIEARHLPVFPHRHFLFTPGVEVDEAYKVQNRAEAYALGERLLNARRANGFTDVKLAGPPTPIRSKGAKSAGGKRSIVCCLPGETFPRRWVENWTALLAVLSQRFTLFPPIFGYSSAPHVTRQAFREEVLKGEIPDYVLWIDDDNILSPDGLLLLAADLEEHPEISLAAGWSWCSDAKSITAGLFINTPRGKTCGRIAHETMMQGDDDLFRVEWTGFPAVLMRGSLLVEAGEKAFIPILNDLPPWYCYGEDISFCMQVASHLMVIDRRVRVPHLKLADNDAAARDLKTENPSADQVSLEAAHEVLEPAGIPA